jgi:CRP-like cAMP-binding protein
MSASDKDTGRRKFEVLQGHKKAGARRGGGADGQPTARIARLPLKIATRDGALSDGFIQLYLATLDSLRELIGSQDQFEPTNFHRAMRFLQILGANSADIAQDLGYTRENVCRWMSGDRVPHPSMRKSIVLRSLDMLERRVDANPFDAFDSCGLKRAS